MNGPQVLHAIEFQRFTAQPSNAIMGDDSCQQKHPDPKHKASSIGWYSGVMGCYPWQLRIIP